MGKRIMSVDDSASVRHMIKSALSSADYDVVEAVDGNDALEKLNGERFHMIITDLNMPNLNGIDLIRKIRSGSLYKFLPIIMVTTESQEAKKREGRAAGATGWIVKPFNPEQLLSIVRKVLG